MWASPGPALWGCPLSFSRWYTHFILGSFTANTHSRFLEGEDGEDTAKIRQVDIVEAVDIASAAKVSLRLEKGLLATLVVQSKTEVGTTRGNY